MKNSRTQTTNQRYAARRLESVERYQAANHTSDKCSNSVTKRRVRITFRDRQLTRRDKTTTTTTSPRGSLGNRYLRYTPVAGGTQRENKLCMIKSTGRSASNHPCKSMMSSRVFALPFTASPTRTTEVQNGGAMRRGAKLFETSSACV